MDPYELFFYVCHTVLCVELGQCNIRNVHFSVCLETNFLEFSHIFIIFVKLRPNSQILAELSIYFTFLQLLHSIFPNFLP